MSAQAQPAHFAETATATETEETPVRTININDQIAGYAALCTESLAMISTALVSIRAYRQSIVTTRSALDLVAPTLIKLTKRQHESDEQFSAAVKAAISACTESVLAEGANAETLLNTVDAQSVILATLKAELAEKAERNELGLVLLTSVLGETIIKTLGVRQTASLQAADCAEAWEELARGADRLWSELNMLQTFEVAQKSDADAVQAVMRWKERFDLLSPVREQMQNIAQHYDSAIPALLEIFDAELSIGIDPETAEWSESMFGVLEKAIQAAEEGIVTLTNHVD